MTIYAYARVSTNGQNPASQKVILQQAYPSARFFLEKASARSRDNRPMLEEILRHIDKDDRLVVWKLDRLARNMTDLCQIVIELETVGATLEILDQQIDTRTASGKAFVQMLGVFAEFETNLRKERQQVGIELAKKKGLYAYKRRRPKRAPIESKIIKWLSSEEALKPAQIAAEVGCNVQTVYNVKAKLKKSRLESTPTIPIIEHRDLLDQEQTTCENPNGSEVRLISGKNFTSP